MEFGEHQTVIEPSSATFVGRDLEVQELLAAHDAAAAGRGRLFLLAGEPGIGKSRLADEVAAGARVRGSLVLWGRCWEDAGAPPYWSWIQVLRAHLRAGSPEAARVLMGSAARDIAQMLPELREQDGDPLPADTSESARFQLFDSVSTFLRRAAEQRPILIVLDDLHAADTASLLLLRFVASQLGDMRVLVVGTYRDVELTPDHPLTGTIAELAREPVTRILTLGGLQPALVRRFIGAAAGVEPHDLLVAAVWRETSGNPLFVSEAIRLLSAEGRLGDITDLPSLRVSVPAGVREVIMRRVDRAGEEGAALLRLGATLGPEFRAEILRRLAGITPAEAAARLDASVREGLLLPVAGALEGYRFAHDLLREALHDEIPPADRVAIHRRVLAVLEEVHRASVEDHLGELAYHAFEAVGGGLPSDDEPEEALRLSRRAVEYATRAGELAARALAFEDAARLYGMALAVLVRDLPGELDDRTEVLLRQGDALARAGDIRASRRALLEAANLARRTGRAAHLARAALGIGGRLPWARPGRDTRLAPLLQDALVMLGGTDERLRVRLLVRLACAWRSSPERREESASLARQAVALARGLDDPATLTYALAGLYWATWWPETIDDRPPLAAEMVSMADSLGDAERIIDAHLMLYMAHAEHGHMPDARREFENVARLAHELRQPAQLWLGTAPRTLFALLEGRLDEADEYLAREKESRALTPARDELSAATFHAFLLRRERGRPEEVEDEVRAAAADFPWYPLHRAALALLLIDMSRQAEARSELMDLARDGFSAFYRDNEWLLGVCLAAEATAALGERPSAEVLYDQLLPFAGRHAIGQAEGSVGAVDRYLGLLAEALGRSRESVEHLRHAVEVNRALGAVPWLAHSQHELARVLSAQPVASHEEIEGLRADAWATAQRIGMAMLASRLGEGASDGSLPHAAERTGATFRLEGEYWTVTLDGEPARVRDTRGMQHLARLLADPGREFHALDLARGGVAAPIPIRGVADDGLADDELAIGTDDAGPQLDEEAKAAYRARIEELEEEISEAEAWNDPERASRARAELSAIAGELGRAVGLGGRDRRAASTSERARVSVTRAIRIAIDRIASANPAAGEHLRRTVRTGTYCAYQPDPRALVAWEL